MAPPIDVMLELPNLIQTGLESGAYERLGGVIRDRASKQVVTWLREVQPDIANPLSQLPTLSPLTNLTSAINLGVGAIGFGVILNRLQSLEQRLKGIEALLEKIDRKIDLSFYANFRTALTLAENAAHIENLDERKFQARESMNRFVEAQHTYLGLTDQELDDGNPIAHEYWLMLVLAYVAEARCHLMLDSPKLAQRRFQTGTVEVRDRVQRCIQLLLTSNPAVYLEPTYKGQVDLTRLTRIYQWLGEPDLTENEVFERLREPLIEFDRKPNRWFKALPEAIKVQCKVKKDFLGNSKHKDYRAAVRDYLPQAMDKIDTAIETFDRFAAYQTEITAIEQWQLSFQDWLQLAPETAADAGTVYYLVPKTPLVAQ